MEAAAKVKRAAGFAGGRMGFAWKDVEGAVDEKKPWRVVEPPAAGRV